MRYFEFWLPQSKAPSWDDMNIWRTEPKKTIVDDSEFIKLVESLKSCEQSLKKSGRRLESKGVKRARLKVQKLLRARQKQ